MKSITLLPRIEQKQQNKNIAVKWIFIMELSNTLDKSMCKYLTRKQVFLVNNTADFATYN